MGIIKKYIFVNGNEKMPIDNIEQLRALLGSGKITKDTFLFDEQTQGWVNVQQIQEYNQLFSPAYTQYQTNQPFQQPNIQQPNVSNNSQGPEYIPNQSYSQKPVYPNQNYNQGQQYSQNTAYNPNLGYNQNQAYNQNAPFNANQGYNQNPNYIPNMGYMQGQPYMQGPVPKKRGKAGIIALIIVVLLAALGVGAYFMFFKGSGLTAEQKNNAQERLIFIASQYNSHKNIVNEPESKDKYGSMAPIVSAYQEHFYKIQQGQNKIQNEISSLNIKGIFTQEVLGSSEKIQQTRAKLRNYLNEYKKYEENVRDSITICKKKVSDSTKDSTVFLTKMVKLTDDNNTSWEKFFKTEETFIQNLDKLLGYLADRQGSYNVTSSGQIQFESSADVTAYNKIYKEMNDNAQNEVDIEKEMSKTNQKNIDALKANKDK